MAETSYELTVADVRRETTDAVSVVFDVPAEHAEAFRFDAGQFLTLDIPSDRTGVVARCYSVCVPPGEPLTVTVKRTPDGFASVWIHDHLRPGDTLRVLPPAGIFTPRDWAADLLLLAAGSGITPVMSILRTMLRDGTGAMTLLYANRDAESVIFADPLRELAAAHPERLRIDHWLETERGLPTRQALHDFAAPYDTWEAFVCGPSPFMTTAAAALKDLGFPRSRRHQERFVSLSGNPFDT